MLCYKEFDIQKWCSGKVRNLFGIIQLESDEVSEIHILIQTRVRPD